MKEKTIYYDGTKLLSLRDMDNKTPAFYICVGNRTAGKSVYYKKLLINKFKEKGSKFILLYRYNYELSNSCEAWFEDIRDLFFIDDEITQESVAKGLFEIYKLNGEICGFAISMSNYDKLKKYSSFFVDVDNILFDEFQSENNRYLKDEIKAFQSIHVTVARGKGKQYRYVRTFLVSNSITLLNPYYVEFGINKRLQKNTRFLKGNGWVMEHTFNEHAKKSLEESAFARAFAGSEYLDYATQNVYLNDKDTFIQKISGMCRYKFTIIQDGKCYGVREFSEYGIIHISEKSDLQYPLKITFSSKDHTNNTLLVHNNSLIIKYLRDNFDNGILRFQNLSCKNVIYDVLSL